MDFGFCGWVPDGFSLISVMDFGIAPPGYSTCSPLARDLFNAAFVSCWTELSESEQDLLVDSLKVALDSDTPEITQTLLNLTEFMEHCDLVS